MDLINEFYLNWFYDKMGEVQGLLDGVFKVPAYVTEPEGFVTQDNTIPCYVKNILGIIVPRDWNIITSRCYRIDTQITGLEA